jgi:hypothetical protein
MHTANPIAVLKNTAQNERYVIAIFDTEEKNKK